MATLIKTNGRTESVKPENGKNFSYKELSSVVGGMVEIVPLPSGKLLVINEEGKLIGLEKNERATDLWNMEYPFEIYPINNDQLVVGDALVCSEEELE